MRAIVVTPAGRGSRQGNRVTALRWAAILRREGWRVAVRDAWDGEACDLLIALHARKSAPSVARFRAASPEGPVVVGLTGTDLYRDLETSDAARRSLAEATRLVVLQPAGVAALPSDVRAKARVIVQGATCAAGNGSPPRARLPEERFDVFVSAHAREVKDPFRAAEAARRLPRSSRVHVLHAGAALDAGMAARARQEEAENPRYTWLGELSRREAIRVLAGSRLLVSTSRVEGGSNAICEAIACGKPILASDIPGSTGLLGPDHPGLFPPGDTDALARLLDRAETDATFLARLCDATRRLRPLVDPAREAAAWRQLLAELRP